jgi:hypothetical protein
LKRNEPKEEKPIIEQAAEYIKHRVKKEKMTTTKKITWLVILVWIAALIFGSVSWVIKGKFPTELLNSVNIVAVPTILSYAVRAGVDFVTRVSKTGAISTETK